MQAKTNLSAMETNLNNKQTGLVHYITREVPKELGDYLCVYTLLDDTYPYIATLRELKDMNLSKGDLKYGKVYIENSLNASIFYICEAETYLGLSVDWYSNVPDGLKTNYYAFNCGDITNKVIRVTPELSESSKELFSNIETMQTTQDNATNSIEEENMQAIKDLSDKQMIKDLNDLKDQQKAKDKYYSDYIDAVLNLTAGIPTWLNTQPTLVWKLDKEASVMLFADEANETFTLKDVKNDINFSLTFEQAQALGIIYNANYE